VDRANLAQANPEYRSDYMRKVPEGAGAASNTRARLSRALPNHASSVMEGAQSLELSAPKDEVKDACGTRSWLFRLAHDEKRVLMR
jgi:hypothetical protein